MEDVVYNALITPMHKVCDVGLNSLYIGNQSVAGGMPDHWNYTPEDYQKILNNLKDHNVIAILCCANNVEIFPTDFHYLQIPMQNNENFDISKCLELPENFININIRFCVGTL
jgi:hypothetical protein